MNIPTSQEVADHLREIMVIPQGVTIFEMRLNLFDNSMPEYQMTIPVHDQLDLFKD